MVVKAVLVVEGNQLLESKLKKIEIQLIEEVRAFEQLSHSIFQKSLTIGGLLEAAKQEVGHGKFGSYLLNFSQSHGLSKRELERLHQIFVKRDEVYKHCNEQLEDRKNTAEAEKLVNNMNMTSLLRITKKDRETKKKKDPEKNPKPRTSDDSKSEVSLLKQSNELLFPQQPITDSLDYCINKFLNVNTKDDSEHYFKLTASGVHIDSVNERHILIQTNDEKHLGVICKDLANRIDKSIATAFVLTKSNNVLFNLSVLKNHPALLLNDHNNALILICNTALYSDFIRIFQQHGVLTLPESLIPQLVRL